MRLGTLLELVEDGPLSPRPVLQAVCGFLDSL